MATHLEFVTAHFRRPEIAPWHGGGPRSPERMLRAQADQAAETDYCLWWWRERTSGELVGYAGLNRDEVEGEPITEIGWSSYVRDFERAGLPHALYELRRR